MKLALTPFGGSGPLLVLGPSLGTTVSTAWGAAAGLLTDRFTVVGWDLPGHGASAPLDSFAVEDLAAGVLAAVDGPFTYAGLSLGGVVGLQLLLDAPGRVSRAVLLSTGARIGEPAGWHERADLVRREGTASLVEGAKDRWFAPSHQTDGIVDALMQELTAADRTSYAAACEALAGFDVRSRLAEVAAPVLAVAGAYDPVTTPASLRHIATGVQHGRLVVLDDASHQVTAEQPELVAALVVDDTTTPDPTTMAEVRARGMRTRREVLGDAHVDTASAGADALTDGFQDLITRYAWGDIWSRPGLDRRTRSMLTLALLAALGHERELAMHVRAAIRNGVTETEIAEVLLHTAVYAGVPASNTALAIAREALEGDA